jgi:hypothetical protein
VDGQSLFREIGPHGLLDDHLFLDGVHPSLRGHIALAQVILDALHARRAFGWPSETSMPRINFAECADHFDLRAKEWKFVAQQGVWFQHATLSLRFDRSQRWAKMCAFEVAVKRLDAGEPPEALGLPNLGVPPQTLDGETTGR